MSAQARPRNTFWLLVGVFALFVVGIAIAGYLYYQGQRQTITKSSQEELLAIADLKVRQMVSWRQERIADAEVIRENQMLAAHVQSVLQGPPGSPDEQDVLSWLTSLHDHYDYQSVFLLDNSGQVRLAVGGAALGDEEMASVHEVTTTQLVFLSDLHREGGTSQITMDLYAPILGGEGVQTSVVGVVLLRIDPYRFLYPLIETWPTASPSAETLLVERDRNEVVYLNDLRHRQGTALTLRLSMDSPELPAARAVLGQQGVVRGRDYRGVMVFAALRPIPGSPWYLVAKVDADEVEVPIRASGLHTAIVVVLLIAAIGAGGGLAWRQRQAQFYRQQYQASVERQALVQRYEFLTRYANDIILFMDRNFRIEEANERAISTYGYSRDELIGMNLRDLRASEAQTTLDQEYAQAREQGGVVLETMHRRRDGTVFPIEASARFIQIQGQWYYQAIVRDITERKRAEEALRESEAKYRSLFEAMLSAFGLHEIICDADGTPRDYRFLEVNRSFEELTGLKREAIIGKTVSEVLPGIEPSWIEIYGQVALTGKPRHFENYSRDLDKYFEVVAYSPKPRQFAAMFVDISERKKVEEQIRQLNTVLEQRVAERTAELAAVNKELEAFSYSVSHDLRAPLRSMAGFSQALLEDYTDKLDAEGQDYLRRIIAASQHMAQLIDDLLNLSRVTRSEMHRRRVDLTVMARAIADELCGSQPDRQVEFDIAEGVNAEGDPSLLQLVLSNLLGNAWKFTAKHPRARIEFGAMVRDGETVYYVRDDGVGFDMAYAGNLFGAFQRLHSASDFEGTGIGLATVQRIVHRHGGRVWAEGAAEQGATFYFTLQQAGG